MTPLRLTVNGTDIAEPAEPRTHLADFLRDTLNLTATHLRCEQGVCGACTILVDGEPVITDDKGTPHDWRVEMINACAALQKADGSFAGDKRWMEDNPVIVTPYVMDAMEQVLSDLQDHPAK